MAAYGVVDHFRNQYRLTNTCSAELTGFTATLQRGQDIYGFDTGLKDFETVD